MSKIGRLCVAQSVISGKTLEIFDRKMHLNLAGCDLFSNMEYV